MKSTSGKLFGGYFAAEIPSARLELFDSQALADKKAFLFTLTHAEKFSILPSKALKAGMMKAFYETNLLQWGYQYSGLLLTGVRSFTNGACSGRIDNYYENYEAYGYPQVFDLPKDKSNRKP